MTRKPRQSTAGRVPAEREPGSTTPLARGVTLLDLSDGTAFRPPSDVAEVDDAVRIRLELPGVPQHSVQVWVRGDCIEVSGEKAMDFPRGESSFLCLERIFGKFRRVFEVVGAVNLAKVSARMRDGILVITIPKIDERRGRERRVPVTGE